MIYVIFECPDGYIRVTMGGEGDYPSFLDGMADIGYRRIGELWL